MNERIITTRAHLRRLRNEINFGQLFRYLRWPFKRTNGKLSFVCPECSESQTSVNPKTNLARCFRCQRNWNPIDFTMDVSRIEFIEAGLSPLERGVEWIGLTSSNFSMHGPANTMETIPPGLTANTLTLECIPSTIHFLTPYAIGFSVRKIL